MNVKAFENIPDSELNKVENEPSTNSETLHEKDFFATSQGARIDSEIPEYDESDFKDNATPSDKTNTDESRKTKLGAVIKPKFALNLLDVVIPSIVVFTVDKIGYSINKKVFKLTKEDIEILEEPTKDLLNEIEIDFNNPYTNFAVVLGIIYGTKVLDNWDDIKPKGRKKLTEIKEKEVTEILQPQNNAEKFEVAYNTIIEDLVREKKYKWDKARDFVAENMKEKIKGLMQTYGVTDEIYLTAINKKPEKDFNIEL